MTTQAIGSYQYSSAYTKLREAAEEQKLYALAKEADQETTSSEASSAIGKEILSYLSEIPTGDDGKLSFQDVDDYREKLETEWDVEVMADLQELGVDITQEIPLTYDSTTGKVTVNSGNENKEIIDAYFENNPDKVEAFQKIVQLGKLTSTADTQLSQTELVQNIQQQALAWWYADNTDPTTWFDGGGLLTGKGISSYTGINITV